MQPNLGDIERFFSTYDFDNQNVSEKINKHGKIINLKMFVESHISYLKHNKGKKIFIPYYKRLQEIYEILKNRYICKI